MKKLLILLLSVLVFACTKKDVEPELSAQIEGIYTVYHLELFGDVLKLPNGGITMGVQLLPVNANRSNYSMTINNNGQKETETGTFDLKKNGEDIELYEDGDKVGYIRGTFFEYNLDGDVVIKGKK